MSHEFASRFWSKVRIASMGCWEWLGAKNRQGYGSVGVGGGRTALAHRVAWEIDGGPIPLGLLVRHKCDNPACVRPAHLLIGTQKQNMADMYRRGRGRKRGLSGSQNPNAKLNESAVRQLRDAAESGEPLRRIAERLNVSPATAHLIATRKTWRHV